MRPDAIMSQRIAMERLKVHSQTHRLPLIGRMVHNTMELLQYEDRNLELCVMVLASMCKGDTTTASKTTSRGVEFDVFRTWWDHLKYDLKEGRIGWLPIWVKRRLRVNYLCIKRQVEVTYPVEMLHVCPHAGFDWEGNSMTHIEHLYPKLKVSDYTGF